MTSIAVIGAGAWGTTIANILADNGVEVLLWCYKQELADVIAILILIIVYLVSCLIRILK